MANSIATIILANSFLPDCFEDKTLVEIRMTRYPPV